ncbi:MAG: hypothetical protein ACJAQT_004863 [Akkermansiaceae bacterium]|jgi:hypothetical protein
MARSSLHRSNLDEIGSAHDFRCFSELLRRYGLANSPLAYDQLEESGGTVAADSPGNSMDSSFVNTAGLGFSSASA